MYKYLLAILGFGNDKMSRCRQEYDVKLCINLTLNIFGAFAKLRKRTVSSAIPVCLFICRSVGMEQLSSRWAGFHDVLYMGFFKYAEKDTFLLKSDKRNRRFT
jgi:hypothetical protein